MGDKKQSLSGENDVKERQADVKEKKDWETLIQKEDLQLENEEHIKRHIVVWSGIMLIFGFGSVCLDCGALDLKKKLMFLNILFLIYYKNL